MLAAEGARMAIVWLVEWDGISEKEYDELRRRTKWDTDLPNGLEYQVAAFSEKGLVLTQVWKSPEHVMRFMEERLLPAVEAAGIRSMPRVDQHQVHSILTPYS
jgi:hypothetical protein